MFVSDDLIWRRRTWTDRRRGHLQRSDPTFAFPLRLFWGMRNDLIKESDARCSAATAAAVAVHTIIHVRIHQWTEWEGGSNGS